MKYAHNTYFYSLDLRGIQVWARIHSNYNRKYRRAVLLSLYRNVKKTLKELRIDYLDHSDAPIMSFLHESHYRTKGKDALGRDTDAQNLGYLIRILRTKSNLTQQQFAKLAGVSQSLISSVEHGKRIPNSKIELLINVLLNPNLQRQSLESSPQSEPKSEPALH